MGISERVGGIAGYAFNTVYTHYSTDKFNNIKFASCENNGATIGDDKAGGILGEGVYVIADSIIIFTILPHR